MADQEFANPRLASLYDSFDVERVDLHHYVSVVKELSAQSVLDIGCGTGTLLCKLAENKLELVGVDRAQASLDIAGFKQGANRVQWFCGEVTTLPETKVDLALMTGNVAQVFTDNMNWKTTLLAIKNRLNSTGRFVFEARDPAQQGWLEWTKSRTFRKLDLPGIGIVEAWVELTNVSLPLVSFKWTYHFKQDDEVLTSESTLRFREKKEIEESLIETGFRLTETRDAPDRPGKEFVFISSVEPAHGGPLA